MNDLILTKMRQVSVSVSVRQLSASPAKFKCGIPVLPHGYVNA